MPGPEGPAHTTPGSEAEHRSRLRAFTFCTKQSQDCHAQQGAVRADWPVGQISLGHYAVTHDAAWLRWIAEKSSRGSVGRRMDRTREHTTRQTRSTPKVRFQWRVCGPSI